MKLADKKILITGGAGFIGSHVVDSLREDGCRNIFIPRSKEYNLLFHSDLEKLFQDYKPDIVIHLAAKVGGIIDIRNNPGAYYYENTVMGTELLEKCRLYQVEKFVAIGTNCAYPEDAKIPFEEDSLLAGYPQKINAPYGIAKRALYQQCLSYKEQYGLDFIYLIPTNAFGERDHFEEDTGHVIPSLIRKFITAKNLNIDEVVLWGSGNATREFMYVKDLAKVMIQVIEVYKDITPLNIGTGIETSIKELAEMVADLIEYRGKIKWDATKPEGYFRKCLCIDRMKKVIPDTSFSTFKDSLNATIDWYKNKIFHDERCR